jgi:hypothetical protein
MAAFWRGAWHTAATTAVLGALLASCAAPARAYSVLTHEALVDTLWNDAIVPALKKRFPDATEEQLTTARAYTYGGCIIQDVGYYPFGSHLFSELTHYIRSADFIETLVSESQTLEEYAFALGATAHYGADVAGHSIAVNRAVPILYPKLRAEFGDIVTYGDDPSSHLKTEFSFDVLQVGRGHYAPQAYHDFIGFKVSKDLLDRATRKTYGLRLNDIFGTLDLAFGTYRFTLRTLMPDVTKAAWKLKKAEIVKNEPGVSKKKFLYNLSKANYTKEWGTDYRSSGFFVRFVEFCVRLLPKVGPLRVLSFRVPTPETEKMFEKSFDAAVDRDKRSYADISNAQFRLSNRDLDTGDPVSPGEYRLTDLTYDKLLRKLADKKFEGVSRELRENILSFYAAMKTPDKHGTAAELAALKAYVPPAA